MAHEKSQPKIKSISEAVDKTIGTGFHQVAEIDSLNIKTIEELMAVPEGGVPESLVMKPPFYHAPFPERDNPAKSAKQRRLFGAALAIKRGKAKPTGGAAELAEDLPEHKIREFAKKSKRKKK